MSETFINNSAKEAVLKTVCEIIENLGFEIAETNADKPWGAYCRLADTDAEKFIDTYFSDIKNQFETFENLSPKYLIVAPNERLSWQYHFNRAEHWRVLSGAVGIKLSDDDVEPADYATIGEGSLVQFPSEKRHRLIGLGNWGVVVEIWQHINPNKASDESDIVRVADDYSR